MILCRLKNILCGGVGADRGANELKKIIHPIFAQKSLSVSTVEAVSSIPTAFGIASHLPGEMSEEWVDLFHRESGERKTR